MVKKERDLILKVTKVKTTGHRRINIPKEVPEEEIDEGDLVKVKKVEIK